jgi:hypothetical protein
MGMAVLNGVHSRPKFAANEARTERVKVTPEMAGGLLALNTKNRTIIKAHLRMLEECLQRGDWVFNGEPIIVASSGRILDGQHRLLACVNTGVSIDTNIVYGVDESVFATIDQGKSRTVGNVLDIAGEENYNAVAAALKVFWVFAKTGQVYDGGRPACEFTSTIAQHVLLMNEPIRDSVKAGLRCEHYKSKSLLSALHYIFTFSNHHVADELVEVMEHGGGEKDRPFHVLREHVIYCRLNRVPLGNRSLAAKTIRAFNAEVTGEWVKRLQFKPDGQFPAVVGLDYKRIGSRV